MAHKFEDLKLTNDFRNLTLMIDVTGHTIDTLFELVRGHSNGTYAKKVD